MPNTYRVTHCFQAQGGTSDDMYCNQFYFFCAAHAPADVDTWGPILATYVHSLWVNVVNGQSVSKFYHPRAFGNGGATKIYDVTANPALTGPPIFTIADSVLVPAADYLADLDVNDQGLPEEVAVCLSYNALPGLLVGRRRGRIYLGPLNFLAVNSNIPTEGPTRVGDPFMNTILGSAQQLQEAAAANDFEWRVFSTRDGSAFKIVNFSVDDSFDTVRGRGCAPSFRQQLAIA